MTAHRYVGQGRLYAQRAGTNERPPTLPDRHVTLSSVRGVCPDNSMVGTRTADRMELHEIAVHATGFGLRAGGWMLG